MTTPAVLEPLIAAGVTATVRFDGQLAVRPAERITTGLDAYLRRHRDQLIAALSDQLPLSAVIHHPPCPGCGSVAAPMLRAGDPTARCARCTPLRQVRPWQAFTR
jgi:hypothetical protein